MNPQQQDSSKEEVKNWYSKWVKDRYGDAGIVSNAILEMLFDFANSNQPQQEVEKAKGLRSDMWTKEDMEEAFMEGMESEYQFHINGEVRTDFSTWYNDYKNRELTPDESSPLQEGQNDNL
jgi:hypothetical protein